MIQEDSKRTAALALSVVCLTLALAKSAAAFDFSEHEFITREAIARLLESPPSPLLKDDVLNALATLTVALDEGGALCKIDQTVFDHPAEQKTCFMPSDLAAMSGDHAASPLLLKWRFFDANVPSHTPNPLRELLDTLSLGAKVLDSCVPPENALSIPPLERTKFLSAVRDHSLPVADKKNNHPPNDVFGDDPLGGADYSYLTLASNGCSHFRDVSEYWRENVTPTGEVRRALAEERSFYTLRNDPKKITRSKPNYNSFAWYADLHAGALSFARAAAHACEQEKRRRLTGLAMVFELASLHYLEDSVAAGHTVTDAKHRSNYRKKESHDDANDHGIEEVLPAATCSSFRAMKVDLPATLRAACDTGSPVTVFGDHILFSDMDRGLATKLIAEAVVAKSFERVLLALRDTRQPSPLVAKLEGCTTEPPPSREDDIAWTWSVGTGASESSQSPKATPWFYTCAFDWWEASAANLPAKFAELDKTFDEGDEVALEMLPFPTNGTLRRLGLGTTDPGTLSGGCGRCGVAPGQGRAPWRWGVTVPALALIARRWRRRRTPRTTRVVEPRES